MDYYTWSAQVLCCSCTLLNWAVKKGWQIRCPKALHYNSKYVPKALHCDCSHRHADVSKGKEEDGGEITNQPKKAVHKYILFFFTSSSSILHSMTSPSSNLYHLGWVSCCPLQSSNLLFNIQKQVSNRLHRGTTQLFQRHKEGVEGGWKGYMEGRKALRKSWKGEIREEYMDGKKALRKSWKEILKEGRKKDMDGKKTWKKRWKEILQEERKRNLVGRHGWKESTEEEIKGKQWRKKSGREKDMEGWRKEKKKKRQEGRYKKQPPPPLTEFWQDKLTPLTPTFELKGKQVKHSLSM